MPDPSTAYTGEIYMFAGAYAPQRFAFCDGTLFSVQDNPALFSIIGNTYGGNGTTNFALPDLRSRVPVGQGQSPGNSYIPLGQELGHETTFLAVQNLPPLILPVQGGSGGSDAKVEATTDDGDTNDPTDAYLAKGGVGSGLSRQDAEIYKQNPSDGSLVELAGVSGGGSSGGTATGGGNSTPFPVVQPSMGINFIICTDGLYPPRP